VANDIPLGCPLLLPVGTVNCVETRKVIDASYGTSVCKHQSYTSSTTRDEECVNYHNAFVELPVQSALGKCDALDDNQEECDVACKPKKQPSFLFNSGSFRAVNAGRVRCAFSDGNLHSRMPLDPMHVRLKRTRV
jgi:hypothetical protein